MKKGIFSLTLTLLFLIIFTSAAHSAEIVSSGTCGYIYNKDDVLWILDNEGTLTISGTGEMKDWNYDNRPPWYEQREYIQTITLDGNITSIGDYAFDGFGKLSEIIIPDSVTQIGNYAFFCCRNIKNISIGDGVKQIGSYAFMDCYNLESITIGKSVTSIGFDVFDGCDSLKNVFINDLSSWLKNDWSSMPNPMNYADNMYINGKLAKNVTIPDDVTEIKNNAFYGWGCLVNITIPNSVTSIGNNAFKGCKRLTSATIPDRVTSIGYDVFSGCDKLENVELGQSITNISSGTFGDCSSLTNIIIPNSVTNIDDDAFNGCSNITNVTIPNHVKNIGSYAFANCSSLTNIIIPNSVTNIGYGAFIGCNSLTDIIIPDSVKHMDSDVFKNCTSLINATMGNGLPYIPFETFKNCNALTRINLGDVVSFSLNSFEGCYNLKDVYINDLEAWLKVSSASYDYISEHFQSNPMGYADNIYIDGVLAKNITIPKSITKIDKYVFLDWNCLESVIISDNVTNIDDYAFYGCNNLANITMSKSVTDVGDYAFYNTNVQTVYYAGSHDDWDYIYWGSGNDILKNANINYQTCGKDIYWYITDNGALIINGKGDMTDFTAKTEVPWYSDRQKISKVILSDGITSIGNNMFSECEKLTEITIPESIAKIGTNAFNKCENLATVSYSGTIEEWDSIQIDTNNSCLYSARFYCKIPITTPTIVESETEFKWNFDVSVEKTYTNSYVYAVAYDNNNTLIDIIQKPLNISDSTNIEINKNVNIDNIKIFVWTDNMQPITTVWEREI